MENVANFRDLGGISCGTRKVKSGLFYRSTMLDLATPEDVAFLRSLGLKVVFDYRDTKERVRDDIYSEIGAKHVAIPATYKNAKIFKLAEGGILTKVFTKVNVKDIIPTYRSLPIKNPAYQAMVASLVAGETPFLQHCTAGKDRAGIGCAVLLLILGADYQAILKDYLLSASVAPFVEKLYVKVKLPGFLGDVFRKRYAPLMGVYKELLDAALEEIIDVYGSYEEYFLADYGLDAEAITALRNLYTIPDER